MDLNVELTYTFTPEAEAQIAANGPRRISFPADGRAPIPVTGDLVSVEELMPHVFIVKRRHLHWVEQGYMQISMLLDVTTEH